MTITIHTIAALVGVVLTLLGYIEARLRSMKSEVKSLLDEREKLNEVRAVELKENLKRVEHKLDLLMKLQLQRGYKHDDQED